MFTILEPFEGIHTYPKKSVYKTVTDFNFCKIHTRAAVKSATMCKFFSIVREEDPSTLPEMLDLAMELANEPHKLAIRAMYKPEIKSDYLPKRRKEKCVDKSSSRVIIIDIDDLPIKSVKRDNKIDLSGWASQIRETLNILDDDVFPENVGLAVHASSSAGFTNTIKCHVYIETAEPVTQAQLRQYFYGLNKTSRELYKIDIADLMLYNPVQPHYFADPIFTEGVENPFKGKSRIYHLKGELARFPADIAEYVNIQQLDISAEHYAIYDNYLGHDRITQGMQSRLDKVNSNKFTKTEGGEGFVRALQALFHEALQSGYDTRDLMRELLPRVTMLRGEDKASMILATARNNAIRNIYSLAKRWLPKSINKGIPLTDLKLEDTYHLKLVDDKVPEGITFMKATLGTGKTTLVERLVENGSLDGFGISITNTAALVESIAERLGGVNYKDDENRSKIATAESKIAVGTIHSLNRIKPDLLKGFNWVFIDECDAVLCDLLLCQLMRDQQGGALDNLISLLGNAKHIILSDGDISVDTVKAYASLVNYQRTMYRINHIKEALKDIPAYEHVSENSLLAMLQYKVAEGKKCLLVSDSGPTALNLLCKNLELTTGKTVKVIHKGSREDTDVEDIVKGDLDVLHAMGIDVLLCSPSLTNGVDFSGYFDTTFVLTQHKFQTPNLRFQALMRERQPKELHFFVGYKVRGFQTGYTSEALEKVSWKDTVEADLAYRRYKEFTQFAAVFRHYLITNGARVISELDPYVYTLDESAESICTDERTTAIMDAKDGVLTYRHNDAFEVKEKFKMYLGLEELDYDQVYNLISNRTEPWVCAELFHKIYPIAWEHIEKCTKHFGMFAKYIKENPFEFYKATDLDANPKEAEHYLNRVGIEEPGDFETAIKYYEIYCFENSIEFPEKLSGISKDFEIV